MKKIINILFFFILIFQNIYSQEINFLNIADLKDSLTIKEELDYLNNNYLNNKDQKIGSFLILALKTICDKAEIFLDKEILSSQDKIDFQDKIEKAKKLIDNEKDKEFLNSIIINLNKNIDLFTNITKELNIQNQDIILDFNKYLNICYAVLADYLILEYKKEIDSDIVLKLAKLTNYINDYYSSLKINLRIRLMSESFNPLTEVKAYFYNYINKSLKEFIKSSSLERVDEFLNYLKIFNNETNISKPEEINILKNNNIDLNETILKLKNLENKNFKEKLKKPIQKCKRRPSRESLEKRRENSINKKTEEILDIENKIKNSKSEIEKENLLLKKDRIEKEIKELEEKNKKSKEYLSENIIQLIELNNSLTNLEII